MPYVYRGNLLSLANDQLPLIGKGNCIDLIKEKVPGLIGISTRCWTQGQKVVGSEGIEPGTAIAIFEGGAYPQDRDGNKHAALFLAYGGAAIWVIDQWKDDKKRAYVGKRLIYPKRPMANGNYAEPGNSAGAFYVIELKCK